MNPEMWADPFTRRDIDLLKGTAKYLVVDPIVAATMGSGEVGMGVLARNEQILAGVDEALAVGEHRAASRARQVNDPLTGDAIEFSGVRIGE